MFRSFLLALMAAVLCMSAYADNVSWDVTDNGDPLGAMTGTGTESDPYLVEGLSHLALIRDVMDKYDDITEGKHFRLTCDIVINKGVLEPDGSLTPDSDGLEKWIPIGKYDWYNSSRAFKGVFDGDGHTVSGLYVNDPSLSGQGFIAYCDGGRICNLTVSDSYICCAGESGAICGVLRRAGVIENCVSLATIHAEGKEYRAGGIVGYVYGDKPGAFVRGCENRGMVTSRSFPDESGYMARSYVGGIAGEVSAYLGYAYVDSCTNRGTVCPDGMTASGGIAGGINSASVRDCTNYGTVTAACDGGMEMGGIVGSNSARISGARNEGQVIPRFKGDKAGGIAGAAYWNGRVDMSVNIAGIRCETDSVFAGGICGYAYANNSYPNSGNTVRISGCVNEGDMVSEADSYIGGIAGYAHYTAITDSRNRGDVSQYSSKPVGGIAPWIEAHCNIYDCVNEGRITGKRHVGGVVGQSVGNIYSSVNFGDVTAVEGSVPSYIGGICAYPDYSVINCYNTGAISGGKYMGGIVGSSGSHTYLSGCYNTGSVRATADNCRIGGIIGNCGCSVSYCYNLGHLYSDMAGGSVGGIAGIIYAGSQNIKVSASYHAGLVESFGENARAGAILGYISGYNDVYDRAYNCFHTTASVTPGDFLSPEQEFDMYEPTSKEISREELGTSDMVARLNGDVADWDTPKFTSGLYRPVCLPYNEGYRPGYTTVSTLDGDSVRIDFGEPWGNDLCVTDDSDMVRYGYNVSSEADTPARRVILSSEYPFGIPVCFGAEELTMRVSEWDADDIRIMSLPFAYDASVDTDAEIFIPMTADGSQVAVARLDGIAQPHTPLIWKNGDVPAEICVTDATLVPYGASVAADLADGGDPLPFVSSYGFDDAVSDGMTSYYALQTGGVFVRRQSKSLTPFTSTFVLSSPDAPESVPAVAFVQTGVTMTYEGGTETPCDIYRLDGVKVASEMPVGEAMTKLPKGIYIAGGKKIVIK